MVEQLIDYRQDILNTAILLSKVYQYKTPVNTINYLLKLFKCI